MAIEIERRFLLSPILVERVLKAEGVEFEKIEIEQFYLSSSEDGVDRYRKEGNRFLHTQKVGFGLMREEVEKEISESQYYNTREEHRGNFIQKLRFIIKGESSKIEIDQFRGSLKGLVILEAEFKSKQASTEFALPPFLDRFNIKEVTRYREFTNGYLSKEMRIPSIDYELSEILEGIICSIHFTSSYDIRVYPFMKMSDFLLLNSTVALISSQKYVSYILNLGEYLGIEKGEPGEIRAELKNLREELLKVKFLLDIFEEFFKKEPLLELLKELSKTLTILNDIQDMEILFEFNRELNQPNIELSFVVLSGKLTSKWIKRQRKLKRYLAKIEQRVLYSQLDKNRENIDSLFKQKKYSSAPVITFAFKIAEECYRNLKERGLNLLHENSEDIDFYRAEYKLKRLIYALETLKSVMVGFDGDKNLNRVEKLQLLFDNFNTISLKLDYLRLIEGVEAIKERLLREKQKSKDAILESLSSFEIEFDPFYF